MHLQHFDSIVPAAATLRDPTYQIKLLWYSLLITASCHLTNQLFSPLMPYRIAPTLLRFNSIGLPPFLPYNIEQNRTIIISFHVMKNIIMVLNTMTIRLLGTNILLNQETSIKI